MSCQRCQSDRIAYISAKCSDCFVVSIAGEDGYHTGEVPCDLGIGGDDYVEMKYCLDCGQIQGAFPVYPELENE